MRPFQNPALVPTRESLRTLACYVLGPARKARTGRIALVPRDGGVATPRFDDGSQILVVGDELVVDAAGGRSATAITTVRAAAAVVGVDLSPDPGVGHDLPPFEPDAPLAVDRAASLALGGWYAFGAAVLDAVRDRYDARHAVSEPQLWPEHFDLAVTLTARAGGRAGGGAGGRAGGGAGSRAGGGAGSEVRVNLGASPGDESSAVPYLYVGPWDRTWLATQSDGYWNQPYGAALAFDGDLDAAAERRAMEFVAAGLDRLGVR
jgi:hypothetical protein